MVSSDKDAPEGGLRALGGGGDWNVGVVVFYPQEPEKNIKQQV